MSGEEIEDVYLGCANQAGEDNRNVARMAVLLAGLPESVAGVTLNRLCASGPRGGRRPRATPWSPATATSSSRAGSSRCLARRSSPRSRTWRFRAATRTLWDTTLGWRFPNPRLEEMFPLESMGETGENVAERWDVSREDQDAFALESQRRWAAAQDAGRFDDELVAVGDVERDEHPRPDTSAEKLAGAQARVPRRTARSRPATRPASTTAPLRW